MVVYSVENQWGGDHEPWHQGGVWIIGSRSKQNVIAINLSSPDKGKTFTGDMTYQHEGHIGVKASGTCGNSYDVENQWGGNNAPWHKADPWVIGARDGQRVIALSAKSDDGGKTLTGKMTYEGEGPIGFKAVLIDYNS